MINQHEAGEPLTSPLIDDPCSEEWERLESEDKLGCARGVMWALAIEAALAIGAALCWKLHLLSR